MSEINEERIELDFVVTGQQFGEVDWRTPDGTVYAIPCFLTQDQNGEPLFMHWFNTTLRTFPNHPWANHIDYLTDEGEIVGVSVTPDVFEQFQENHYPEETWHIVDPATIKWIGYHAAKTLDQELEELQGGDGNTGS